MIIDQNALARRLRETRERRGLTQDQVAQALGMPRTGVVQIESGNRSVSSLELSKLARLYSQRIDSFFAEEEQSRRDDQGAGGNPRAGENRKGHGRPGRAST